MCLSAFLCYIYIGSEQVAQLAVPEVAQATFPRFCDGGADAEKAVVCKGLLSVRTFAFRDTGSNYCP